LVSRITPVDNTNFEWIINLGEEKSEKIRCTLTGRKNSAEFTIGDGESCHFTYWLINLLGLNGEIVIKSRAGELLHRLLLQRLSLQSAKQHPRVFITKTTVQERFPVCLKLSTALANSGNCIF